MKLISIRHRLMTLQSLLEELRTLLIAFDDQEFVGEIMIISDAALKLENIRLYKLLYPDHTRPT